MKVKVRFYGRQDGAIGAPYWIETTVGVDFNRPRDAVYCVIDALRVAGFETFHSLTWVKA